MGERAGEKAGGGDLQAAGAVSVVAWDGKTIAADKQATCSGLRFKITKIRRIASGEILAGTGDWDSFAMVAKWYEDGADPAKWPACQADKENWSRLIVAGPTGVKFYERQPVFTLIEDEFMAWGSGRDYAMGAMRKGATAAEAVEIAMEFDNGCGLGVDAMEIA